MTNVTRGQPTLNILISEQQNANTVLAHSSEIEGMDKTFTLWGGYVP